MASRTPSPPRSAQSSPLLALPTELVLAIAHPLSHRDLSRLGRSSLRLHRVLASRLHVELIRRRDDVFWMGLLTDNPSRMRQALAAGATVHPHYLWHAANAESAAAIIVLLDECDVHPDDPRSGEALQTAIKRAHQPTVDALLSRGATIDHDTAVMDAVYAGSLAVLELLLQRGAAVPLPEDTPYSPDPVCYALFHRRHLLAPFVARGHHREDERFGRRTALEWAVRFGDVEAVRLLVAGGVDVDEGVGRGRETPLHVCVGRRRGGAEMLAVLLEAGADVGAMNGHGQTPLQVAACRGDVEAVRMLVDRYPRPAMQLMCWNPPRARKYRGSMAGMAECRRILDEAGIITDEDECRRSLREALGRPVRR